MATSMLDRALPAAIFCLAVVAMFSAGAANGLIWLHYLAKPLTTLLILSYLWRAGNAPNARYRHAIMVGIVFSAFGDVFLMLPETLIATGFMFGLGSFLIAHLFFLRALSSDAKWFGKLFVLPAFVIVGALNLAILWPGLGGDLKVPVLLYIACLIAMTSQAVSRFLTLRTVASGYAAFGGIIFLLSDTLIAYNKFHAPIIFASVCILATYYAALWLIAKSACSEHLALKE
ncbi:MAG TPA: lysoplasmalogenase [Burkholderiaceae bacterium]|jgi:uncharacterized membrane protein YhhN